MISFNVTHQLHEVSEALFKAEFEECKVALAGTVTGLLNLPPLEGFELNTVFSYHNQVYDTPLSTVANRKLGMTHGSRGIVVIYTLNIVPTAIGFSDSNAAFEAIKAKLVKAVTRHVFTDVARTQALNWNCAALQVIEGSTLTHMSSDYLSIVTHSAFPTSSPTSLHVKRQRNRTGVIAGTVVGVTAFVIAVMVFYLKKSSFGIQKHPDVVADEVLK